MHVCVYMYVCVCMRSEGCTSSVPPQSGVWEGVVFRTLTPWRGPGAEVGVLDCVAASGTPHLWELVLKGRGSEREGWGRFWGGWE